LVDARPRSAGSRAEGAPRRGRTAPAAAADSSEARTIRLGLLPGLLGYQLRLAQRAVFDDFAASIGSTEISPGLFGILVIIEANPGLKQSELAAAAQLDRSSIVPVVDKLEARGYVARRGSAQDRRVNGLFLTADGAAALRRLKRKVLAHEHRISGTLQPEERRQLLELLARLRAPPR
jgi:DNA-binding MarR family transcriptional regulator